MNAMERGSAFSDYAFLADRGGAQRKLCHERLAYSNARKGRDLELLVNKCMDSWTEFCELSVDIKKSCMWPAENEFYPSGYELKAADASKGHVVEYMQVSSKDVHARIDRLGQCHDRARCIERNLMALSLLIFEKVMPQVAQFFNGIGMERGKDEIRGLVGQRRLEWGMRLAHTSSDGACSCLVEPHVDPSFVSANLIDDGSVTEYLDDETRAWIKMPCPNAEMVIFGGIGLQYYSGNGCKALCHRVRRPEGEYETFGCTYMLELPFMRYGSTQSLKRLRPGLTYDASLDDIGAIYNGTFGHAAAGATV